MSDVKVSIHENENHQQVMGISFAISQEILDDFETFRFIIAREITEAMRELIRAEDERIEHEFLYGTGENKPVGIIHA